jgi:hypothetical protein
MKVWGQVLYFNIFSYVEIQDLTPGDGLEDNMTKEDLVAIIRRLLRTEQSLNFLLKLDDEDVRTLIVCIRDRVDRENRDH